jgi:hypothetical protein
MLHRFTDSRVNNCTPHHTTSTPAGNTAARRSGLANSPRGGAQAGGAGGAVPCAPSAAAARLGRGQGDHQVGHGAHGLGSSGAAAAGRSGAAVRRWVSTPWAGAARRWGGGTLRRRGRGPDHARHAAAPPPARLLKDGADLVPHAHAQGLIVRLRGGRRGEPAAKGAESEGAGQAGGGERDAPSLTVKPPPAAATLPPPGPAGSTPAPRRCGRGRAGRRGGRGHQSRGHRCAGCGRPGPRGWGPP